MWSFIVSFIIRVISDEVVMDLAKKLITKAVDSTVKKVGITDSDAKHLISEITRSTLNDFKPVK